jgi:hypothetical protein
MDFFGDYLGGAVTSGCNPRGGEYGSENLV